MRDTIADQYLLGGNCSARVMWGHDQVRYLRLVFSLSFELNACTVLSGFFFRQSFIGIVEYLRFHKHAILVIVEVINPLGKNGPFGVILDPQRLRHWQTKFNNWSIILVL